MMRRIEDTVRLPGAKMAPVRRTLACGQTGRENTGTKMEMTAVNVLGNESITNDPFRLSDSWILVAGILPQITEIG